MELQKDLVALANPQNGIGKTQELGFVQQFNKENVTAILSLEEKYGDLIIKTHSPPTDCIKSFIESGKVKTTFNFRDPRDTILSVVDHGARTRNGKDASGAFANIHSIKDALSFAKASIQLYYQWKEYGHALFIKYEDLMMNKVDHLFGMARYFGYMLDNNLVMNIYEKHENMKESAWNYNTGRINRWKEEMSEDWIKKINYQFGKAIEEMGYQTNL